MKWNNKTVLVTGAGGFIGSHLVERLVELGARVRAFVRYNSRNDWGALELLQQEVLKSVEVTMGDLRDSDAINKVTSGTEVVFHLGAIIAIPYSYKHPAEVIETNIMGSLNALIAARNNCVDKFIHTSTSEVYGTAKYVPIDEKHLLQGQSPYSASKIGADKIAESFYLSFALPVVTIRPFNTFGPRQSARAVIPTIISQALTQDKIYIGSLHPKRDYTYVADTIDAFIKIAESPQSTGETINIGSNFEISIGEIAKKVLLMIGKDKEVVPDDKRVRPEKSEVERLWCDNTKARQLLGWEPLTSFDKGLEMTIKWISEHKELYKPIIYNI